MTNKDDKFDVDQLIDSLYQESAGEQPSATVDNLILAKARGQTVPADTVKRKPRWHVPVVFMLAPAIALGLVLKMNNFGRIGAGSGEIQTASTVYDTDDFVLHIPKSEADSITRPEKPDFSDQTASDTRSLTSTSAPQADVDRSDMRASAEAEINVPVTAPDHTNGVLAKRGSDDIVVMMDEESRSLGAMNAPQSATNASTIVTAPEPMADQSVYDLAEYQAVEENSETESAVAASAARAKPVPAELPYTQCTEPRSAVCTKIYRPVCAERDNGRRCVRAPCDSTDMVTYSNACTACADEKVYGHRPGACPE